ncbi:MAG: DUF3307 domain-containing protein [Bacteroidota bacterium]
MASEQITFFTFEQGNIIIRLLIAHFLSDFVFQTKNIVANKKWLSKPMLIHISIVYACTSLLTGWWIAACIISVLHYLIDGFKIEASAANKGTELSRFLTDQLFHIIVIIAVWTVNLDISANVLRSLSLPFINYRMSLILLGYLIVIAPLGYIIKFATQKMLSNRPNIDAKVESNINNNSEETPKNEHGGQLIGIFERIIILTFVLLGQYEAIGFLITGKSIIRFTSNDGDLKSEYVLVGTMMSYSMSILIGVMINWLLSV